MSHGLTAGSGLCDLALAIGAIGPEPPGLLLHSTRSALHALGTAHHAFGALAHRYSRMALGFAPRALRLAHGRRDVDAMGGPGLCSRSGCFGSSVTRFS